MTADARRVQLIDAAFRVMARDGVTAGTTRAICAEAGMALATFHYCFRSRDDLLRELMVMLSLKERVAAESAMGSGGDLADVLRRAAQGYLRHLEQDPGHELVLFELNHHALRTPELRDLADEQYRRYDESATNILVAAAKIADVTWQVELPLLARLVVTMMDGLTTTWLVDHDSERAGEVIESFVGYLTSMAISNQKHSSLG